MDTASPFGLAAGVGQRSEAFRFERYEGAAETPLGLLHPIRGASISQSGGKSLSRTLSFDLGETASAEVDFAAERIRVALIAADRTWPLGEYRFTDHVDQDWPDPETDTVRTLTSCTLGDAMVVVDTELESAFTAEAEPARDTAERLLAPLGLPVAIEDSPHLVTNAWMAGTSRRQVLEAIAELGGYLPPWVDHEGVLRMRRLFDPAAGAADFDFDAAETVFAESVTRADDSLTRPNRVVVVSNAGAATGASGTAVEAGPVTAFCDVPSTAPHSIQRIGFVRPEVVEVQVDSAAQAQAVADVRCLRQTVAETLTCATALDPRHDGWATVEFQGLRWLEYGWSAQLEAGGEMTHQLQRSYMPTPVVLSGTAGQIAAAG